MGYHLFIDPLSPDFRSAELKALLEQFGDVRQASIVCDSVGASMGFGRAEMDTEEAAKSACNRLNMTVFHDALVIGLRVP
jgi:RNA recognition motif-containing protein